MAFVLPNFLIIGAARAGTTSLHHYLRQHPSIYLPELKEPRFFAFEPGELELLSGPGSRFVRKTTVRRLSEYRALFADVTTETAIGEASPLYLRAPGAAQRIRHTLPDAKLIAILRQPAERAYAGYLGALRDGYEPAPSFEEALDDEPRRNRENWMFGIYARPGFYHRHLSEYYRLFPANQIRVFLFEEFLVDSRHVLDEIFDFLGVDQQVPLDTTERRGVTGIISNPLLRILWKLSRRTPASIRSLVPAPLRDRAFQGITRRVRKPALSGETRRKLTLRYESDIRALESLIDRDLSSWLE